MAIPSASRLQVLPNGLSLESLTKPLSWEAIFGNQRPVELEIGVGKGNFLTSRAKANPEINFFGIEWAAPLWRYASDRLRRNACVNARMVRAEAGAFVREYIPSASLSSIHIYFPDPWPKRRHHKRRLVQDGFIREVARCLAPGGEFRFATDHLPYFEQVRASIENAPAMRSIPFHANPLAAPGEQVGSNFEKIFRSQGTSAHYLAACKS